MSPSGTVHQDSAVHSPTEGQPNIKNAGSYQDDLQCDKGNLAIQSTPLRVTVQVEVEEWNILMKTRGRMLSYQTSAGKIRQGVLELFTKLNFELSECDNKLHWLRTSLEALKRNDEAQLVERTPTTPQSSLNSGQLDRRILEQLDADRKELQNALQRASETGRDLISQELNLHHYSNSLVESMKQHCANLAAVHRANCASTGDNDNANEEPTPVPSPNALQPADPASESPLLTNYFDKVANLGIMQERLSDLQYTHNDEYVSRNFRRDQGQIIEPTDEIFEDQFHREYAEAKGLYLNAFNECNKAKAECVAAGIDPEEHSQAAILDPVPFSLYAMSTPPRNLGAMALRTTQAPSRTDSSQSRVSSSEAPRIEQWIDSTSLSALPRDNEISLPDGTTSWTQSQPPPRGPCSSLSAPEIVTKDHAASMTRLASFDSNKPNTPKKEPPSSTSHTNPHIEKAFKNGVLSTHNEHPRSQSS